MDEDRPARNRRHPTAPPTEAGVRAHAQRYLAERSTSRAHLRRLLLRRVERANTRCAEARRVPPEQLRAWVDAALDTAARVRLVDDARYAADRAATLARRGGSDPVIRARLQEKGVAAHDIEQALDTLGTRADRTLVAALALARRRRVGPFRVEEEPRDDDADAADDASRPAGRDAWGGAPEHSRALGILARGGFPWDVANRVLAMSREEAEDLLARGS
jgi:regulatory protein